MVGCKEATQYRHFASYLCCFASYHRIRHLVPVMTYEALCAWLGWTFWLANALVACTSLNISVSKVQGLHEALLSRHPLLTVLPLCTQPSCLDRPSTASSSTRSVTYGRARAAGAVPAGRMTSRATGSPFTGWRRRSRLCRYPPSSSYWSRCIEDRIATTTTTTTVKTRRRRARETITRRHRTLTANIGVNVHWKDADVE